MIDLERIHQTPLEPVVPAGCLTGLLPPEPGWQPGDCSPLFSSDWEIPEAEWSNWRSARGMIDHVPHVFRQQYGSCAAESAVSGLHVMRQKVGVPFVLLNPLFAYHYTSGGADRGSTLDGNLRVLREQGCPPESVWPYRNGFRTRPSADAIEAAKPYRIEEFYEIRSKRQFVSALLQGYVVACGSRGHAILAVHYDGTDYPIVLNTWGTTWGEGGFGRWDRYDALWRTYRAFAYRNARIDQ